MGNEKLLELPVIDLGSVTGKLGEKGEGGALARAAMLEQLKGALQDWSACQIINHGIPLELLDELWERLTEFFSQPSGERYQYHADALPESKKDIVGGLKLFREGLLTFPSHPDDPLSSKRRETLQCFTRPADKRRPEMWPQMVRKCVPDYGDHVYDLSILLLELMSESLGLPSSAFERGLGPQDFQMVGINCYPPVDSAAQTKNGRRAEDGIKAHSDTTAITILLDNGIPGLQMLQKNGQWASVKPLAGSIIVQVGVWLEVLSNGEFKAGVHRVISPSTPSPMRISVACGYRLPNSRVVEPVPELLGSDKPALYKPLPISEFMAMARADGMIKGGDSEAGPYKIAKESPQKIQHNTSMSS